MKKMNRFGVFIVAGLMLPAVSALAGPGYDSRVLELKNVTGTVHVRTANVDRISVDIDDGAGMIPAPKAILHGGVVEVRGKKIHHANCTVRNHKVRLSVGKYWSIKKHPLKDFPTVTVIVPTGSKLKITGGRVFGEAGDLASADVQINGCGTFTLGAISGDLDAQVNGSGDFVSGAVGGDVDAQVNGSGDLSVASVAGQADAQINGSGDLRLADVSGGADAQVNGSGDLYLGQVKRGLDAQVNGSGDVHVAAAYGKIDVGINGSGDIIIKGGEAAPFNARIIGSGDVAFHGHANGVDARVTGSGDITLASYEGAFHASKHGVHVQDE